MDPRTGTRAVVGGFSAISTDGGIHLSGGAQVRGPSQSDGYEAPPTALICGDVAEETDLAGISSG
jgi:hypothetical protein